MTPAVESRLRALKWAALRAPARLLTGGVMKVVRRTKVEAYTDKHEGRVASRILAALERAGKRAKGQLLHAYRTHAQKADSFDALIGGILDQVDVNGVGVAVVDAFGDDLRAAFRQAGLTGVAEVGIEASDAIVSHVDVGATAYAAERGAELVTQISDSTREDLVGLLGEAVDGGWSTETFAAALEDAFSFSDARSQMIARTELAFAHVGGNVEGWRQSGEVEEKQWLASADACPICEDLDGETVGLEEQFDFDGEQVDGPPGHPNCRCDLLPILKPEGEGE